MTQGGYNVNADTWLRFDLMNTLPVQGGNTISIWRSVVNTRLVDELPVEIADVELEIRNEYPDGEWRRQPGWYPRT